ncbi:MAG: hypothetical protein AAFO81_10255 [Pseudomonadota bacterium]
MNPPLRVGILLDSDVIPIWVRNLADAIAAGDHATICVLMVDADRRSASRPENDAQSKVDWVRRVKAKLDRIYQRIVERERSQPDAWRSVSDPGVLRDIPRLKKSAAVLSAEEAESMRGEDIDVWLHCGLRKVADDVIALAKMGVWSVLPTSANFDSPLPAGFWPSIRGDALTRTILTMTRAGEAPLVLYESHGSTSRFSTHDNISRYYAKGTQLYLRMLRRLSELGAQALIAERTAQVVDQTLAGAEHSRMPGMLRYAGIVCLAVYRKIILLFQNTLFETRWTLRRARPLQHGAALELGALLPNPAAVFRADPHFLTHQGRHYLFIEEYCYKAGKGHISVQECASDGQLIGEMVKVLDRPYHLSYPFVFEHDGDVYMVPETSENKTIEIYKATDFPHGWTFQQNLMDDIDAADSTLLFEDGKWWLFANVRSGVGVSSWDELFLFVSDDLWSGAWRAHPMNPIVSDCRTARPAGAILRRDGKLIRPSQESTARYGSGLNFLEIETLTETVYKERLITRLHPLGFGRAQGIHSYAERAGFAIVDENVRRLRIFYSR